MAEIEKYDFTFCKNCKYYKHPDNKMLCMMCIEGSEFIEKI